MSIMRYRPTAELSDLQSTVNRFFGDTFSRLFDEANGSAAGETWTPRLDVYENQGEVVVVAEFPGFQRDDIHISIENGRLTVSADRAFEQVEGRNYHQRERWYGKFYRSFLLPRSVDHEKVSASLQNGLLTITLPKREEAKPRQISVEVR